jgi:hypothetical protein
VEVLPTFEPCQVSDEKGFFHQFHFLNDVPLNQSNPDVRVNVLEYMQTDSRGRETVFSWVTNIHITKTNVFALMKGGRARWKIESAPQVHKEGGLCHKLKFCA